MERKTGIYVFELYVWFFLTCSNRFVQVFYYSSCWFLQTVFESMIFLFLRPSSLLGRNRYLWLLFDILRLLGISERFMILAVFFLMYLGVNMQVQFGWLILSLGPLVFFFYTLEFHFELIVFRNVSIHFIFSMEEPNEMTIRFEHLDWLPSSIRRWVTFPLGQVQNFTAENLSIENGLDLAITGRVSASIHVNISCN